MVVFIDESGIHKQLGHATEVIVYIKVSNLSRIEKRISNLEKKLKIRSFHWGEERWDVRNKFLEGIINLDFNFKAAVFENPVHPQRMIEYVFKHLITENNIRRVFIDGKKPKWYEHKLKKILRDRRISVKTLRTVRSESSFGIQLADCLAGLIRRYYDKPSEIDIKKWFKKLKRNKKLTMELHFETGAVEKFLDKK